MNISGNYDTTNREIRIVEEIFDSYGIKYNGVYKYEKANDGDVVVVLQNGRKILIEVKEEDYKRFSKYGDLGIDFISAFSFKCQNGQTIWKGAPKHSNLLNSFLSSIQVQKWGKLSYSKSDIWLFYVLNENKKLYYHAFFDGEKMISREFYDFLSENCLFAVNNKPHSQLSHGDSHHSACFFINHENNFLKQYKVNISEYIKKA